MLWPTCNGKAIHWTIRFKMSNLHYNWWEANQLLEAIVKRQYEVTLGNYLVCTWVQSQSNKPERALDCKEK
jgi:hypothetical protein